MGVIDRSRTPWKPRSSSYSRSKTGLESKWSCPLFSYKRQSSPFWCSVVMVTAALTGPVYLCVLVHFSSLGLWAYSCLCASPLKLTWSSFLAGTFQARRSHRCGSVLWKAMLGGFLSLALSVLSGHLSFNPSLSLGSFPSKGRKDKLSILPDISDTPNS